MIHGHEAAFNGCSTHFRSADKTPSRCPRQFSFMARHLKTGRLNHLTAGCDSWGCLHCVRYNLIPEWRMHIAGCFEDLARHTFYRVTCGDDEWEGIQRRINRRGGLYMRVRLGETRVAVYFTVRLNLPFIEEMTASAASVRCLREIGELKPTGQRGVSTSRELSKTKKPSQYEAVSVVNDVLVAGQAQFISQVAFRKAADAAGLPLLEWGGGVKGIAAVNSETLPREPLKAFISHAKSMTATKAQERLLRKIPISQIIEWEDSVAGVSEEAETRYPLTV